MRPVHKYWLRSLHADCCCFLPFPDTDEDQSLLGIFTACQIHACNHVVRQKCKSSKSANQAF